MSVQINDPVVEVNNDVVGVVPNSVSYDEGLGEQQIKPVSEGGGRSSQVFANDIESNYAMVRISVRPTIANIELVKSWKLNRNNNTISISADDGQGNDMQRVFTRATLAQNYDVPLTTDGDISLEFQADTPF